MSSHAGSPQSVGSHPDDTSALALPLNIGRAFSTITERCCQPHHSWRRHTRQLLLSENLHPPQLHPAVLLTAEHLHLEPVFRYSIHQPVFLKPPQTKNRIQVMFGGKKNPHKFHLHKFFSLVLLQEQSFKDIFWRRLITRGFSTNDGHTTAVATKNKMKESFIFTQYKRKMLDCHVSTASH